VHKSLKLSIAAALGVLLPAGMPAVAWGQAPGGTQAPAAAAPQAPKEPKVKDIAEYDIFNEILKDQNCSSNSQNSSCSNPEASKDPSFWPKKALQGLDTWTQKYPDSDWKDQRLYMYMQEYAKLNPPNSAKVVEYGTQVMGKGLKNVFYDPKEGPRQILNCLFLITVNVAALPNATADQIDLGKKSALQLKEEAKAYFVPANKGGTADAAWAQARAQLDSAADHSLLAFEVAPANAANKAGDCASAQPMYIKALQDRPDSAYIAYQLANNTICLQKTQPAMASMAIYEFERAAMVDPTLGDPKVDPKQLQTYADSLYTRIHGSDEGLDALKQMAKSNPLPPADFKIKTKEEIQAEKEAEFAKNNPKLALWMQVKGALTGADGETYFTNNLKDSAVPPLSGVVVEGKPECRSKELLVAIPIPGQQGPPTAEINLKLDAPLAGKPEAGSEINFAGVPTAFTKTPFLLTMEAEKAKVDVKTSPCTVAPPRTKKKQ